MKILRYVLAVLLPPAGIFMAYGISSTLLINILLTFLGWIPGIIHALWAIAKHDEKVSHQGTV
ncbi:MAG: YqaE/Pmp3 family membrane protein [Elainellaceae cyanobacterium]